MEAMLTLKTEYAEELTSAECDGDWLAISPFLCVWKEYKCSMTDKPSE